MSDVDRLRELSAAGYQCSQMLVLLGLQLQGKSDPDLVRAAHGLCRGMAAGETCGALTGGAALLGLYAGRGTAEEENDPRLLFVLDDFVTWFKERFGEAYGSLRCEDIIGPAGEHLAQRCPDMVAEAFAKAKELLVENGFDLTAPGPA